MKQISGAPSVPQTIRCENNRVRAACWNTLDPKVLSIRSAKRHVFIGLNCVNKQASPSCLRLHISKPLSPLWSSYHKQLPALIVSTLENKSSCSSGGLFINTSQTERSRPIHSVPSMLPPRPCHCPAVWLVFGTRKCQKRGEQRGLPLLKLCRKSQFERNNSKHSQVKEKHFGWILPILFSPFFKMKRTDFYVSFLCLPAPFQSDIRRSRFCWLHIKLSFCATSWPDHHGDAYADFFVWARLRRRRFSSHLHG